MVASTSRSCRSGAAIAGQGDKLMPKNPHVRDTTDQFFSAGELMELIDEADDFDSPAADAGPGRRAPLGWLALAAASAIGFLLLAFLVA